MCNTFINQCDSNLCVSDTYLIHWHLNDRLGEQESVHELALQVPKVVVYLGALAHLECVVTVGHHHGEDVPVRVVADQVSRGHVPQLDLGEICVPVNQSQLQSCKCATYTF